MLKPLDTEDQKDKQEYRERKREAIQKLSTKVALFEPHVRHVINSLIKTKRKELKEKASRLAEVLDNDSLVEDESVEDEINDRDDNALLNDSDFISRSNSKQEKEDAKKSTLAETKADSVLQPQSFDYQNEASFGAQKPLP